MSAVCHQKDFKDDTKDCKSQAKPSTLNKIESGTVIAFTLQIREIVYEIRHDLDYKDDQFFTLNSYRYHRVHDNGKILVIEKIPHIRQVPSIGIVTNHYQKNIKSSTAKDDNENVSSLAVLWYNPYFRMVNYGYGPSLPTKWINLSIINDKRITRTLYLDSLNGPLIKNIMDEQYPFTDELKFYSAVNKVTQLIQDHLSIISTEDTFNSTRPWLPTEQKICVMCTDQVKNMADTYLGCSSEEGIHIVVCGACAKKINKCPQCNKQVICRSPVTFLK